MRELIRKLFPKFTRQEKGLRWVFAYGIVPTFLLFSAIWVWRADVLSLRALRNNSFDTLLRLRPREYDPKSPVIVADLDDETLTKAGQWPWPRVKVAEMVRRLSDAGATAIAFDIVFAEPDRTSPPVWAETLPGDPAFDELKTVLKSLGNYDKLLAQEIGRAKNVVVGFSMTAEPNKGRPMAKAQVEFSQRSSVVPKEIIEKASRPEAAELRKAVAAKIAEETRKKAAQGDRWAAFEVRARDEAVATIEEMRKRHGADWEKAYESEIAEARKYIKDRNAEIDAQFNKGLELLPDENAGAVTNLRWLDMKAAGVGNFSLDRDHDGIIRKVPLLAKLRQDVFPLLALEAVRLHMGAKKLRVAAVGGRGRTDYAAHLKGIAGINIPLPRGKGAEGGKPGKSREFEIPTDLQGRMMLFDSGYKEERFLPIWKIFEDDFDASTVKGKIVFIGTSAKGLMDIRATPLNPQAAGVEVHAQIAEQVLGKQFLSRPPWTDAAEFWFLLLMGLGLIILMPRIGAALCAALAGAGVAAAFGLTWWAYTSKQVLIDPMSPSLVVLLIYLVTSLINYLRTESEKKQVRGAFSRYMSPALVEQLAKDPSKLKLGGETKELTVMFSDIRGFTPISEQFDAHGLTEFINSYLTPMTAIILDRQGTIDKYMGDCIMAFWNAPLDVKDHASHACRAALVMCDRMNELNRDWEAEAKAANRKYIPVRSGFGLNTGECCVGNMGSSMRFDYSILGDDVNLASRLEGQSKSYGVDIVIGANTLNAAPQFATLELDLIRVKGKTRPVHIYVLLGDEKLAESEEFKKHRAAHEAMIKAYRSQKWDEAEKLIEECRGCDLKLPKLYDLYTSRIDAYKADSPGPDWDGVFTATTK